DIHPGELVVLVFGGDLLDVHVHAVDAGGQYRNHAAAVFHLDTQLGEIFALHRVVPAQGHQAFAILAHFRQVAALLAVHHHALFGAQVALDRVAGDGQAALGVGDHEAFGTADGDWQLLVVPRRLQGVTAVL